MASEASVLEPTTDMARPPRVIGASGTQRKQRADRRLKIPVLIYGQSPDTDELVKAAVAVKQPSLTNAYFEIRNCAFDSQAAFADRVAELARSEDALLIVSDRFAPPKSNDGCEHCDLPRLLRERGSDGKAIIALMALADPPLRPIRLVDHVVARDADVTALADALQAAFLAIRYKISPPHRSASETPPIEIRPVGTVADLRECLALRHDVYTLLQYFEDNPDGDAGLELDYFDQSALHFVAFVSQGSGRKVAGTARLVVAGARMLPGTLFCGTAAIRRDSWKLCDEITREFPPLKERLETGPGGAALPLFVTFPELAPDRDVGQYCEISRLVVEEEFRGLGVSRMLVRACIAAARDLQLKYMLLECIPQHTGMYDKYGFSKIRDLSERPAWRISQLATAMKLALQDDPTNMAVQIAKRDLEMMRTPLDARRSLCMCDNEHCWRNGEYKRKGKPDCPLPIRFMQH